ncbi:MAG: hypothetical protein HY591_03925 [Candidatus Omnitrophica bacterium]|nr:hypothetical protein [Candidatus Omnitrophota bacterium]
MLKVKEKKLLKIGNNSYALVLPKEFVSNCREVVLEYDKNHLNVSHKVSEKSVAYEQALFAQYAGKGPKDLSVNRKKYLKESLRAKYRPH